jgi:hypothetical protein
MNWIRVAVGIGRDGSVGDLARACGVSRVTATGHYLLVLTALPEACESGDLSSESDDTVEEWAQWRGKRGVFAQALRRYLCTEQGVMRSWEKYNGAALREANRAAERAREWRENRKRTAHERRTVRGTHTVPNDERTHLRNETRRDETNYITATDSGTADAAPPLVLELDAVKSPKSTKKPAAFPNFPVPMCDQMHGLWVSTFGACEYSRFRKEFGSLFTLAEADRPAEAPSNAELAAALKSYADLAPMGAAARFANVNHAAGCLAAIARTRRELADDPSRRSDAVMRIIHGRAAA